MKLSRKEWNKYVTRLSAINKTASRRMQAWIDTNGTDDIEALVAYAHALTTAYGEAASATACEMYDEISTVQKAHVPPAVPKQPQNIKYVEKAVRGTLDRAPSTVPDTVSEMVKRTGAETTLKNAKRDGAYFAWVPNGDSCAFCITLASNGWRRASKKTVEGDHKDHIHANCDCEFAISFNGPGNIEGYDPEKYREMYDNAEGDNWRDKVNSMRRADYAVNKDEINKQKRIAYFKRTANEERLRRVHFGNQADFESDYGTIRASQIKNTGNNVFVTDGVALTRKEAREADRMISTAKQLHGVGNECNIPFVIVDSDSRLAAYNPRTNVLFISKDLLDDTKTAELQVGFACPDNPNSTLTHELFHWKDAEWYRNQGQSIRKADNQSEYAIEQRNRAMRMLRDNGVNLSDGDQIRRISEYAYKKWLDNDFEEVYAEYRTKVLLKG